MKNWFITGVSSGFGHALVQELLAQGHRVAGTLRSEAQRAEFAKLAPGATVPVLLDVTDHAAIPGAVAEVEKTLGPIDVFVNNAGYGYEGPLEETRLEDARRQFEVNVFGAFSMMQAVLPYMRARRRGHILNVTSMGGLTVFPGVGVYNSSKFALEALNAALAKEVAQFGIKVTAIEPGGFRTDWAGRSMQRGARTISDYDASFEPQRAARRERSGRQTGDPAKAAKAMIKITEVDHPPVHLLLGSDALSAVRAALAEMNREIDTWESLTLSTDVSE
ncbi:MAG TPA: oxidoreductase [Paraburkholderia sp.]|nr:oxidoreductase [Paraburkholderia sp.]